MTHPWVMDKLCLRRGVGGCYNYLKDALKITDQQFSISMPKFKSSIKHSGSIQRNACVACETAMRDCQESMTTGQTHGHTDGQTDRRRTK